MSQVISLLVQFHNLIYPSNIVLPVSLRLRIVLLEFLLHSQRVEWQLKIRDIQFDVIFIDKYRRNRHELTLESLTKTLSACMNAALRILAYVYKMHRKISCGRNQFEV